MHWMMCVLQITISRDNCQNPAKNRWLIDQTAGVSLKKAMRFVYNSAGRWRKTPSGVLRLQQNVPQVNMLRRACPTPGGKHSVQPDKFTDRYRCNHYFVNSSTTTEMGGRFTIKVFPDSFASLKVAGVTFAGSSKVLRSCIFGEVSISPVTLLAI